MLLLTGATGLVGSAVLRRLTAERVAVRCLVRDPRRLGAERVRVQIALGDLSRPASFRNALRGVDTVIHLAGSIRDQAAGSIEELNGIATWRMVEAAERAGVEHFVFTSVLGASSFHRARFFRAKALAEDAVAQSSVRSTIFAPSVIYAPGDRYLTMLARLALLPVIPMSGSGRAEYQPITAADAADCIIAALEPATGDRRFELAGPEIVTHRELIALVAAGAGRHRPILGVPTPIVSRSLKALEAVAKGRSFATWDEAELMEISMTSEAGMADAASLGVIPRGVSEVLAPV